MNRSDLPNCQSESVKKRQHRLDRMRLDIELGWEQSSRNDVVDGRAVFAEIRALSKARRARRCGRK